MNKILGPVVVFLREHAFELAQLAKTCADNTAAIRLKELGTQVQAMAEVYERKLAAE